MAEWRVGGPVTGPRLFRRRLLIRRQINYGNLVKREDARGPWGPAGVSVSLCLPLERARCQLTPVTNPGIVWKHGTDFSPQPQSQAQLGRNFGDIEKLCSKASSILLAECVLSYGVNRRVKTNLLKFIFIFSLCLSLSLCLCLSLSVSVSVCLSVCLSVSS